MGSSCTKQYQVLLNSDNLLNDIKNLDPGNLFDFIEEYSELKSLKSNSKFLRDLENKFLQIQNKNESMQLACIQSIKQNKLEYQQQLAFLTNQIYCLVEVCCQQRKMVQQYVGKIHKGLQQKQQILDKFKSDIKKIKQKSRIIKSGFFEQRGQKKEQIEQREQHSKLLQKQIQNCQQTIQKSFHTDDDEISKQQALGITLTQVENMKTHYTNQIYSLNRKIEELKKQIILNKKSSNEAYNYLCTEKQQKILKLSQKIVMLSNKNDLLSKELQCKNEEIAKLKQQLKNVTSSLTTTHQQIDFSQRLPNKRSSSQIFSKLINSKIIFQEYHTGKKLLNTLQQILKPISIKKSKLLFTYDQIQQNNMFQYISGEKNLLFLGKLKNNTIIGGFSKQGFKLDINKMDKNVCFIFSFSLNLRYYKLQLKEKNMAMHSVKLDKNFLRFGSNQLRISCGTNKGISSINTSSSVFECKANVICNLQDFLGQKQQKYELQQYQIFQIQYQNLLKSMTDSIPQNAILSYIQPSE